MFGALKGPVMSVSPSVKSLKKYYSEYAPVIHPEKVATRKHVGNGPPTLGAYLSRPTRPSRPSFSVVTPFINLPSRYSFRQIDDKRGVGTLFRVLYNFSTPTVTADIYPIRASKFSNPCLPIPAWTVCGAGRFTPIQASVEAVRSSLRGPHQSECRQNSLCNHNKIVDLFNAYFCEIPVNLLRNNKLNKIPPPDKHRVYINGCDK
jgi:hypothetical protein